MVQKKVTSPTYPLFILARDDFTFRRVTREQDLDWYEPPDIEDGLFEGWDSDGRHFQMLWNAVEKRRELQFEENPSLSAFRDAINEYARRLRQTRRKIHGICTPEELLEFVNSIGDKAND